MREKIRAGWAWARARWLWFFVPTAAAMFVLGVLVAVFGIGRTFAAAACVAGFLTDCTVAGAKPRTLWDLLALILVPLALAGVGYFFSVRERQAEQDIAKQRAMDDALKSYLDAMGGLLTDKGLSEPEPPEHVRKLARAYTLTVLTRIDGERRGAVVRFLYEAGLITSSEGMNRPKVEMHGAHLYQAWLYQGNLGQLDLSGACLQGAFLNGALLIGTVLIGAHLEGALLIATNLKSADLQGAYLQGAYLNLANLQHADLRMANLREAQLINAHLQEAILNGANLQGAILYDANLQRSYLQMACLEGVRVDQAQLDTTNTYRDAQNLPSHLTPDSRPWPRDEP